MFTVRCATFGIVMFNSLRGKDPSWAAVPRRPPEPGRSYLGIDRLKRARGVDSCGLPLRQLRLQLADAALKLLDHGLDFSLRKPLVDVLGTVDVPRFDGEDDGPLDLARIVRVTQAIQQLGVILDHPGGAPQLDPLLVGVIHQEDERLRVLRQVAERDVLAVAAEVGEGQRLVVQHLQKAGRAAPVLDVRLPLGAGRAQVEHIQPRQELGQVRRHTGLPAPALHLGVTGP